MGKTLSTGEELIIRACSIENMDNQCGTFKFDKDTFKGCILTCDYDGCNGSTKLFNLGINHSFIYLIIITTFVIIT